MTLPALTKSIRFPGKCHFIHFNDVYNLEPAYEEDPIGGAARFATVIEELRQDLLPAVPILLFSGDFVGPSLMSTITQGAHIIEVFNLLEVDYGTFGNHDYDYGYQSLQDRLKGLDDDIDGNEGTDTTPVSRPRDYPPSQTKWICTNISEKGGGPVGGATTKRTELITVDGVKVGLLAVSEDWLLGCQQLKAGELVYEDFVASARKAARQLRALGAEVVLCLTHSRLECDQKLAEAVPEIDLLLGGHDHFYKRDRKRRIVKGGEEWRWVNHVSITAGGGVPPEIVVQRYDVDEEIKEEPRVLELMEKYRRMRDHKYQRVLAQTDIDLDATERICRFREGVLPNWICDVVAEDYSVAKGLQSSDIVLLTGFSFGGNRVFPAGELTLGDVFCIFPKPCGIVVISLSGEDIVRSLTHACQGLPRECGLLHHCNARLSYRIVLASDEVGPNSVSEVKFDGKAISLSRKYRVAISDFMATGRFGFDLFANAERLVCEEHAMQIQDIVKMYCDRHQEAIQTKLGRIEIVNPSNRTRASF